MGEYRLQVYQELEIQDLLEATGVSTDCKCTRSWRYRTCCRPHGRYRLQVYQELEIQDLLEATGGKYRLQVYQELEIQDLLEATVVSTASRCTRS